MVQMNIVAMYPGRPRPTQDASQSSESGFSASLGYRHTNGYFYSPSDSCDTAEDGDGLPHQFYQGRRNSSPVVGSISTTFPTVTSSGYSWSQRASGGTYRKNRGSNGFLHVGSRGSGISGDVFLENTSCSTCNMQMQVCGRPLRRSISAGHRLKDQECCCNCQIQKNGVTSDFGMPRASSEGDLECDYVTLDRAYKTNQSVMDGKTDCIFRKYSSESCRPHNDSIGYVSSGSGSGRNGSGSTDSLSCSRTLSVEKSWLQQRTEYLKERGKGTLQRRKSAQTLQTVAENIGQAPLPAKSILKNGSNTGSGTNTSLSANSSRRSSLNSRAGASGSQDSDIIVSMDLVSNDLSRDPLVTPASLNIVLSKKKVFRSPSENLSSSNRSFIKGKVSGSLITQRLLRSKSLSDLRRDDSDTTTANTSGCYSDDEDGDDFGFLSYSFNSGWLSRPLTAMQKAKTAAGGSSSPSHRLLPRRWRNKNKNSSSSAHPAQAMWSHEGPCTWCSVSGRKVILRPVSILRLSEAERVALQKLALSRLQSMELSCPIVIPKDASDLRRQKRRTVSLKRRSKSANLATLLDTLSASDKGKDKENKEVKPAGLMFGIPLWRCIANDKELVKRRTQVQATALKTRSDSADLLLSSRHGRKSSSSSQSSLDNNAQNGSRISTNPSAVYDSARRAASSDSLSESDHSSRNTSSNLIDALSLHEPHEAKGRSQAVGSTPQVPHIVDACFKHLETFGLQVLGIFRVGSSKKRVKQLREEFDSGKEVYLTEEHNPHDVGALLKEFFRDLPEPLLTRDLYLPFVATRKLKDRETQVEAVKLLLALLPPANRDTLWALLRFLATVNTHSTDSVDGNGQEVSGNKMDSYNLATLFGPNVLHRARAVNEKQFMAECAEQAEQTSEVIGVIKDMIDNHYELFEISAELRDEILKLMMEADQENLDKVLRRLSNENQIEPDPESTCSVFEESEPAQSLPHSANSDADLLSLVQSKTSATHQPLRISRSADPWTTDVSPQAGPAKPALLEGSCGQDATAERFSGCPSPLDSPIGPFSTRTVSLPRPPVLTLSPESSQVVLRGHRGGQDSVSGTMARPLSGPVVVRERPSSEIYSGNLNIPKPAYLRENSGASSGSSSRYPSSSGSHASDGSGQSMLFTPPASRGSSPQPQRCTTAPGTPLQIQRGSRLEVVPGGSAETEECDGTRPAVGSPEWQRERWRHWQQIAAGRNGSAGDVEQETLV